MDVYGNLKHRPLTPDQVSSWADLYTAILTADEDDEVLDEDDLAEEFADPSCDYDRGSLAVFDGDRMVGYCVLRSRVTADSVHEMRQYGGVHPQYRSRGIGGELLEWSEQAAKKLHEERFGGASLALGGRSLATNTSAATLFAEHGYLQARWFHKMTRDLSSDLPVRELPDGVRIAGFTAERSAGALFVRNEAFRDHWGSADLTPETWTYWTTGRGFQPGLSFVADLNGEPTGMILAHEYEAYNKAKGTRDLYIPQVATRRAGRRRGIASALLLRTMAAAKGQGFETASLEVDADSPTGALGLYERLGFAVKETKITYRKVLSGLCGNSSQATCGGRAS